MKKIFKIPVVLIFGIIMFILGVVATCIFLYVAEALIAYTEGVKSGGDFEIEEYLCKKLEDYPVDFIKSNGFEPVVVMDLDSADSDFIKVVDDIIEDETINFVLFKRIYVMKRDNGNTGFDLQISIMKARDPSYYEFMEKKH